MHQPLDIEAFRWRLAETIAWCSKQAMSAKEYPRYINAASALRKYVLRPPSLQHMEFDHEKRESSMNIRSFSEIKKIVDTIAAERALLLRRDRYRRFYPTDPAHDLSSGRLLLYAPHDNLADGAAEAETDGFFDTENEPPWDTWIDVVTAR